MTGATLILLFLAASNGMAKTLVVDHAMHGYPTMTACEAIAGNLNGKPVHRYKLEPNEIRRMEDGEVMTLPKKDQHAVEIMAFCIPTEGLQASSSK